jgi:glutathione S-transferase
MKLFYTGNSPYARRPRLAVAEFGLGDKVELVDVNPLTDPNNVLYSYGPGAKVPALETDTGAFVCETLLILRILDEASGGKMYPSDPAARGTAFQIEGVASLLMDSLFLRSHENRRDPAEKSAALIEKEAGRAARCYDALEGFAGQLSGPMNMGILSAAASLGYADGRHPGDKWRDGRPKLAAWYADIIKRPSLANSMPNFG